MESTIWEEEIKLTEYNSLPAHEKGMFLYGGSTIILLLEKDKAAVAERFFEATQNDEETPIVMGESLM